MAKPIKATPTLRGKDADDFLRKMIETENRPMTLKEKEMAQQIESMDFWSNQNEKVLQATRNQLLEIAKDEIKFLEMLLKWDIDKEDATMDKPIKERLKFLKSSLLIKPITHKRGSKK